MNTVIKIALHKPTGQLMHIDNAANGIACECECLKCSEKLEAIQGEVRTKHFRHHSNKECQGSQETALHELGKQILVQGRQILLPKFGQITYSDPKAEHKFEKIRPDVTVICDEKPIYFEIFVSHLVDEKKDRYIKMKQIRCIEIDLSSEIASTYDQIKQRVLNDADNKRIVFWNSELYEPASQKRELSLRNLIVFFGLIIGLTWLVRRK